MSKAPKATTPRPHDLAGSTQDATLQRQYLHVLRGSDRAHGPHIAELHRAYLARAAQETPWSFVGFVARLIEAWAQENAR